MNNLCLSLPGIPPFATVLSPSSLRDHVGPQHFCRCMPNFIIVYGMLVH